MNVKNEMPSGSTTPSSGMSAPDSFGDRAQEEIRVLEVGQRGEIDGDRDDQQGTRGRLAALPRAQDPLAEASS